jgi:hypothetical protein
MMVEGLPWYHWYGMCSIISIIGGQGERMTGTWTIHDYVRIHD